MISEAARFREIGNAIGEVIVIETEEYRKPSRRWTGLYKSWSKFSKEIERAVINGDIEFKRPIEIYDINDDESKISIPNLPTAMAEIKFGLLLNKLEEISDNGNGNTERMGRGNSKGKGNVSDQEEKRKNKDTDCCARNELRMQLCMEVQASGSI